jgi:hypothetical protein
VVCKRVGEHMVADADGELDPAALPHIGQNHLGRLLMEIRSELAGLMPQGKPLIRSMGDSAGE